MKSFDQILLDNPPFYPDALTHERKMRFMFLLEDGRLIGHSEGQRHSKILGLDDNEDYQLIEEDFCNKNKCLRLCFQSHNEGRTKKWTLYIEVFEIRPNEAQWATLGVLFNLKGRSDTSVRWDVLAPNVEKKKRRRKRGEGSLCDFRRVMCPHE